MSLVLSGSKTEVVGVTTQDTVLGLVSCPINTAVKAQDLLVLGFSFVCNDKSVVNVVRREDVAVAKRSSGLGSLRVVNWLRSHNSRGTLIVR